MPIKIQRAEERGKTDYGWLKTRYSFSFADYYNPERMGFGELRVLNDDHIAPAKGFGMHHHDNMEIVTIVLEGAVRHEDSMGNKGVVSAGEVQRISAGNGIMHSEFNASNKEQLHLLQIWVEPKEQGIEPSYEQKKIAWGNNEFSTIVSGTKSKNAVYIHQHAEFRLAELGKEKSATHKTSKGRGVFVFVVSGKAQIGMYELAKGDSAEIVYEKEVIVKAEEGNRVLLIEVPV